MNERSTERALHPRSGGSAVTRASFFVGAISLSGGQTLLMKTLANERRGGDQSCVYHSTKFRQQRPWIRPAIQGRLRLHRLHRNFKIWIRQAMYRYISIYSESSTNTSPER